MTNPQPPQHSNRIWEPQPGPQLDFLRTSEDEAYYGGAKGGGKSDALLFGGLEQVENPDYRAIIFRRTYPQLSELIERSKATFPQGGAVWNEQQKQWRFPSGAIYKFGHCQHEKDKENYQGQEFHYMAFDQLEQFTETMYTYLIGNVRTAKPGIRLEIRASGNPGGIGHLWVKKRFIDGKRAGVPYVNEYEIPGPEGVVRVRFSSIFIQAKVWDNKILLNRNPMYLANLMQLPPQLQKAFLEGDWNVFEGQYFDEWRNEIHVVKPFKIPATWNKFVSIDYGYKNPASVHWWAVDYDGRMFAYRELYGPGLTFSELAKAILRMTPSDEKIDYWVADPAIWNKTGVTDLSGMEVMAKEVQRARQYFQIIPANNDRINGWRVMREYLSPYSFEGKRIANIAFFETCVAAIRTIPALVYDSVKVEDVDTSGEDHAGDETRYAIMSRPVKATRKDPPPTRTAELWEKIEEDITKAREDQGGTMYWEEGN